MGNLLIATLLPTEPARKPRVWPFLALCLISACFFAFFHLGRWLIAEDPLQNAAAIAVLSGRMPSRALEAAKVYKQGYAPQVWLTHSTEPGATPAAHAPSGNNFRAPTARPSSTVFRTTPSMPITGGEIPAMPWMS